MAAKEVCTSCVELERKLQEVQSRANTNGANYANTLRISEEALREKSRQHDELQTKLSYLRTHWAQANNALQQLNNVLGQQGL
jgi:hypothetical protein